MKLCKCGKVVESVCSSCSQNERGTATERGYGSDWTRVSLWYRSLNPVCEYCRYLYEECGKLPINPATEVHHIIKVKMPPQLRCEHSNLLALCHDCHDYLEENPEVAKRVKNARSDCPKRR